MKIETSGSGHSDDRFFDEDVEVSVDNSSPMILTLLTNIYSDSHKAVLQEYASNAFDSHVRAGQSKPVKVSWDHWDQHNLTIQDFGVGMSRDELRDYAQYGSSTKRKTNSELGGFGIGAKAGLSICDEYTVTAVKDGKKNVATIYKKSTGAPAMGLEPETDTDAPNGVTIEIPISAHDHSELNRAYSQGVFFGWDPASIEVNSKLLSDSVHLDKYQLLGEDLGWIPDYSMSKEMPPYMGSVMVGPVRYSINWNNGYFSASEYEHRSRVILNMPIGSVDVTPSREELSYSPKTISAIFTRYTALVEQIPEAVQEQIDNIDDRRDVLYALHLAGLSPQSEGVLWRGEKIDTQLPSAMRGLRVQAGGGRSADNLITEKSEVEMRRVISGLNNALTDKLPSYAQDYGVTNVLVTGVPSGPDGFTAAARSGLMLIRSIAEEEEIERLDKIRLYFVHDDITEFSEWNKAVFDLFLTAEKAQEMASNMRKRRMRESRAKNAGTSGAAKVSRAGTIKKVYYSGQWYERRVPTADLDPEKTYILLQYSEKMTPIAEKMFNLICNPRHWKGANHVVRSVMGAFDGRSDYQMLLATPQQKVSDVLTLPNVYTAEDGFAKIIQDKSDEFSLTHATLQTITDMLQSRFSWTSKFITTEDFDRIKDPDTKHWLSEMFSSENILASRSLSVVRTLAEFGGVDLASTGLTEVKTENLYGDRYPLLQVVLSSMLDSDQTKTWAADYINMVDAS